MISYAVSIASFGHFMTPELADALRKCKMRNLELIFQPDEDTKASRLSGRLTRELLREGKMRAPAVLGRGKMLGSLRSGRNGTQTGCCKFHGIDPPQYGHHGAVCDFARQS